MCEFSCREFFTRHSEEEEAALYFCRGLCRKIVKYRLPEIVPFSLYPKESSGTRHYRYCVSASWTTAGYDTGLTHILKWNKWSILTAHCIVRFYGYRTTLPCPGTRLWGTLTMVINHYVQIGVLIKIYKYRQNTTKFRRRKNQRMTQVKMFIHF